MRRFLPIYCLCLALPFWAALPAHADEKPRHPCTDVVLDWNSVLLDATKKDPVDSVPTRCTRNMAMVHTAIYDAVNAVRPLRKSYALNNYQAPPGASAEAAASQAACAVLSYLFPDEKAVFKKELDRQLVKIKDPHARALGIKVGNAAALACMRLRATDGSDMIEDYEVRDEPGRWVPTAPDYTLPVGMEWGAVKPYCMKSGSQFRPGPPPPLTGDAYIREFYFIKSIGSAGSRLRTPEQTLIGIFWSYDQYGVRPPPIQYNQILQQIARDRANRMEVNAYLFALANMAMADAAIACWDAKFTYNHWRPITAIREAESDGNNLTKADAKWLPLGASPTQTIKYFTPPFPAYPSGHATMGEAMFRTLRNYYKTDRMKFTCKSDELPGVTRTFTSFSAASRENAFSRIYIGVHWTYDATVGVDLGRKVADYAYANVMLPVKKEEKK